MKIKIFLGLVFLSVSVGAFAADLNFDPAKLTVQEDFKSLSKVLGNTIRLTQLSPAESLGIIGFDIGVEATFIEVDKDASYWKVVLPANQDMLGMIPLPRLRVQKGLPLNLDFGLAYTAIPTSNIKSFGGELKWSVLGGNLALPAVAVRLAYSTLTGLDNLDISDLNLDLSVSKGFLFLTPYGGLSTHMIKSEPKNIPLLKLEEISQMRGFVGLKTSLGFIAFTLQADLPEPALYSLKVSVNF